ncbi:YjfB family protein [Candidatus Accumulibacter sp. ACC003]|uniref:YjfB family protein n=1 Tax=Candidatus Accumulibacter sp. ACC003 TaxID=2823334 RepID=UPI0025BDFD87|nr:YjfB family protein [Candidatus Accumulibacter sp. ACC003]
MEISAIAAAATEMNQIRTSDTVQTAVLKKTLDIQSQHASQLIEAAANVIPNNPPNLGNRVDTVA